MSPLHGGVLANEGRQNDFERALHFRVCERAVRRLEGQPDGQADRAIGHTLALVPIEEDDGDERRSLPVASRLNGATNDLRRQGIGDHDREIAHDERMPRQRLHPLDRSGAQCLDGVEVQSSQLGKPTAADPGEHVVTVVVAGKTVGTKKITLAAEGASVSLASGKISQLADGTWQAIADKALVGTALVLLAWLGRRRG